MDWFVGATVAETYPQRAVSWFGNVTTDLNSLIDPGLGWELTFAECCNDAGWIGGTGFMGGTFEHRGWLIRPKIRDIKVPPETWHFMFGGQSDGPGLIVTKKGPIRVPPWTPFLKSLPVDVRGVASRLLDADSVRLKRNRRKT
jgi:hypothetical protein